jgi:cytochrome P450 family 144
LGTTFDLEDPRLLFSQGVLDDPRPLYDQLRREAPVWRIPGQDSYLVSDPALIREAVGRTSEFSSNLVSLLYRDDQGCPVTFDMSPLGDPIHVLAVADPPFHSAHRKLLQPHLSPEAVGVLEEPIRQFADEALDSLLATEAGDVVSGLTNPLPAQVVCRLIGLPADDADRLVQLVWDIGLLLDGVTDADGMGTAAAAALALIEYVQAHLNAAIEEPPRSSERGLLGVLVRGIEDGVITPENALGILMQLINAGTETTSSLMATTIETLARDQMLQERLRSEPELIPQTLEEVLRSDGPFQFHYRFTKVDTTLGGTAIPANSRVLLMWAAANLPGIDEPGGVNGVGADSRPPPHYAFGRGLHFCIGAPLARLEARVVIEQLLQRTSALTLDGHQSPVRRPSISLRRHVSLPVYLAPR